MSHENAIELLKKYGVPYVERPKNSSHLPTFSEGVLQFNFMDPGSLSAIEHTAHEIAHFLLAESDRKRMDNFGLGEDPRGGGYAALVLSKKEAVEEESAACLLGLVILHHHGHRTLHHFQEYGIDTLTENDLFFAANLIEERCPIFCAYYCEEIWHSCMKDLQDLPHRASEKS